MHALRLQFPTPHTGRSSTLDSRSNQQCWKGRGVRVTESPRVGGAQAYGFLSAAFSGGSFAGILLASFVDGYPFGKFTAVSFMIAGVVYALAIAISWLPITIALFCLRRFQLEYSWFCSGRRFNPP